MTTTSNVFCDICTAQNLTNVAIKWCPECEEALCIDCIKQHNISKLSRNHSTIDVLDYKLLPEFVSNIPNTCEEHEKHFHVFCTFHDVACCGQCVITNHSNCEGLLPIEDVVNNAKMSSSLQNVEEILYDMRTNIETIVNNAKMSSSLQNVEEILSDMRTNIEATVNNAKMSSSLQNVEEILSDMRTNIEATVNNAKMSSSLQNVEEILYDMRTNIETIVNNRKENLQHFQSQINNIKHVVHETREQLLKHLDKLENDLIKELTEKESQINLETENVVKDLEEKDLKVHEYQANIKAIKEYGTNIQTFFGTKKVFKYAQVQEKHINTYFEKETLTCCHIEFTLDDVITRCLNAKRLGAMSLTSTEAGVFPVQTKNRSAQLGKTIIKTNSTDNIKVYLKKKFHLGSESTLSITGCDVTPDGNIVLADCSGSMSIVVHSSGGSFINKISTAPHYAFDVSVIDEQRVAVSSGRGRTIQIINILTFETLQIYSTTDDCYGVARLDEKIISAIYSLGIVPYFIQDEQERPPAIKGELLGCDSYVTCLNQNIYYTNSVENSVTYLHSNGAVIWTFNDTSLILNPHSIATDQHGHVFVSSLDNNNIVVISPDGKHGRTILDEKDGIDNAWALCFDQKRNTLVVVNRSGDVLVFNIV